MKALSKDEARTWCESRSIKVAGDGYLYFDMPERHCIAIELPEKPYELVALANALLPYSEEAPFRGALLWIRQWGVWNELVERAGFRVMEMMRRINGDTRRPEEAPGYLFDARELIDLEVGLIQPLLIGWDAFMVPESGDYIVATSHDETTCVLAHTPQVHEGMLAELKPWNAREDQEWYFKGAEIPTAHS